MFALLRPRLLLAWCLAAVLVLTQTLGLIHGMTHGKTMAEATRHIHVHVHASPDEGDQHQHHDLAATPASGFMASVFALHERASDCRLFDQCSHGAGAASVVLQLLPGVMPPSLVAIFQGNALARWAALFDARGPPRTV